MAKTIKKKKSKGSLWKSKLATYSIEGPSFWKENWLPAVLIFLFSGLLYVSTYSFDYVLDDKIVYTENAYVKEGFSGIKKILSSESFEGYFGEQKNLVAGARYRPLSIASFAVEFALLGQSEKTSHLINALLYALNCLLLFRIIAFLYNNHPPERSKFLSVAFIATVIFAAHPLHVEVVANVKGRDEILTLLACLGATYYGIRFLLSDKPIWLLPTFLIFFIGVMTKENTVTFMAILPLIAWYFCKTDFKKIAMVAIPGIVATLLYLFIRSQVIGHLWDSVAEPDLMNDPFRDMNVNERFATITYTLGLYFKLMFYPHPLTHDYYPYHIPIMNWAKGGTIVSLLLYAALIGFAIWGFFKKHIVSFCIVFFIATLSITSNVFFSVGTFMNERFVYVSSVGSVLFMGWVLGHYLPSKFGQKGKMISIALFALFVIGYTAKTIWRTPAWKDKFSLNAYAIEVSKNSARANALYATALYEDRYLKTPSSERETREAYINNAGYYVDRALEIHPKYSSALNLKAGVLAEQYKFTREVKPLLDGFLKLLKVKSNFSYIDEYLQYLNNKNNEDINFALVGFYYDIGSHYRVRQGAKSIANKYFRMGLEVAPSNPQLREGYDATR